jgi:hypothetical protein
MSKKPDLYTVIHKAQRMHLFGLSTRIGRADFSDAAEVSSIEKDLKSMIFHLRKHSLNEATYIHPLFNEMGNQIAAIDEEHDDLEKELLKIEHILKEKKWEELYPELNRFIAAYLTHQDEEERMQVDILWKHFDDDRLAGVMTAFKKSLSPVEDMENLKFMIPSLSVPELTQMFQNIKKSASTSAFQTCSQIAEAHLETSRWQKLCKSLSITPSGGKT